MLQIKIAQSREELEEVYAFRYSIYIQELNKTFLHHDDEKKILTDEFDDDAFHICVFHDEELIGALRLRYPKVNDMEMNQLSILMALQKKYKLSVLSRLMIKRKYRHTAAILSLMNYTYDKNIRDGIDFGVIEVENHLVAMYKKFGFHDIGQHLNHHHLERTILFINGRDWKHFESIGSGFSEIFSKMVSDMNQDMLNETNDFLTEQMYTDEYGRK